MNVGKDAANAAEVDRQSLLVAGVAALVVAVCYVAIFPLYFRVGAPPAGGEAWFRYLPGKTTAWWTILGLSVFTDCLFIPLAIGLYQALKDAGRNMMLLASACVGLFVVLDLAVTWTHYASILTLFRQYSSAASDARRTSYLAAADYAAAMLASPLEIVYAIVTLSTGILLTGFVMLKGPFPRIAGYLGLATGVLGIASLTGLGAAIIGNALFATAWLFLTGYELCRLARR